MKDDKQTYILHLADTTLILGHRNSEWCGHGPILEQDIAITNISLDLIGQARNFYQYAAALDGGNVTEDSFAYHRDANEFLNLLLVEQPNGDWAVTILRQYLFSSYQKLLFEHLANSSDDQLAAIAVKALKEITYHLRWSSEWVIRLGDGTEESQTRINTAVKKLWPYTAELFTSLPFEKTFYPADVAAAIKTTWLEQVQRVFSEATLELPQLTNAASKSGKQGEHEFLQELLGEMQSLPRAYPDAIW